MGKKLRSREACKILGIHRNTIVLWVDQGRLHPYRVTPTANRKYDEDELRRLLKEDEEIVRFASGQDSPKIPLDYAEWQPDSRPSAHAGILRNFADAILRGAPLLSPAEDGLNELALSNAAYLSAWQGGIPVKLPPEDDLFNRLLDERQAESRGSAGSAGSHPISGEYSERWQVNW